MSKKPLKLLILVGCPGSGKTTFAKYFLRTEERWMRICRDDMRSMQFSETLQWQEEDLLTDLIDSSIETLLNNKYNVMLDATHCREEYIKHYLNKFNHLADISFKVFDEPFDVLKKRCVIRKEQTGKYIPSKVLEKFYAEFEKLKASFDFSVRPRTEKLLKQRTIDIEKPHCILVDLDGTLSHPNGRDMFKPKGEEVLADLPHDQVIAMVKALSANYQIIFLSGRDDSYKSVTEEWITRYTGFQNPTLYMRKDGDFRRDSIIKKEILYQEILPNYNIFAAFDDRLQVIRECWNAEGVFCFNVNQFLLEY